MQARLLEQKSRLQFYLDNEILENLGLPSFILDSFKMDNDREIDIQDNQQLIDFFYQNILDIRVYMDAKQGVKTFFQSGPENKRQWVRVIASDDILAKEFNSTIYSICNYLRVFYSYLLSGLTIATICDFNTPYFRQLLIDINRNICLSFWASKEQLSEQEAIAHLAEGKGYLIDAMDMLSSDEAIAKFNDGKANAKLSKMEVINKLLDQTKNWVGLECPSYSISTILLPSEITFGRVLALVDNPCCQLTDDQKDLFKNIKTQLWFIELSPFEKQLILHYQNRILSGHYVVPSPLRAVVPVIKNAYLQSIWATKQDGEFQLINSYYHAGSAAHVSHKNHNTALMITKNVLLQQQSISETHFNLMICLNSSWADTFIGTYEWIKGRLYNPDDSEIINLTKKASIDLLEVGVRFSKICINELRAIEQNDYSGINDFIKILNQNFKLLSPDCSQYNFFKNALTKLEATLASFTFLDLNAKGHDIIHELSLAISINNALAMQYPMLKLNRLAIWFGCASGENRTGIVYYHNMTSSFIFHLEQFCGYSLTQMHRNEIFKLIAKSQHLHMMTGNQGNSFGTEGVRPKSSGSLRSNHSISDLVTSVSDLKVLPVQDHSLAFQLDKLQQTIQLLTQKKVANDLLSVVNLIFNLIKLYKHDAFALANEEMTLVRHFVEQLDCFCNTEEKQFALQKLHSVFESFIERRVERGDACSKLILELLPLLKKLDEVLHEKSIECIQISNTQSFKTGA